MAHKCFENQRFQFQTTIRRRSNERTNFQKLVKFVSPVMMPPPIAVAVLCGYAISLRRHLQQYSCLGNITSHSFKPSSQQVVIASIPCAMIWDSFESLSVWIITKADRDSFCGFSLEQQQPIILLSLLFIRYNSKMSILVPLCLCHSLFSSVTDDSFFNLRIYMKSMLQNASVYYFIVSVEKTL